MATFSHIGTLRLPTGQEDSFEDMSGYGSVLQAFFQEQESSLPEFVDTRRRHDTADYLQSFANGYNEQSHIYNATEVHH